MLPSSIISHHDFMHVWHNFTDRDINVTLLNNSSLTEGIINDSWHIGYPVSAASNSPLTTVQQCSAIQRCLFPIVFDHMVTSCIIFSPDIFVCILPLFWRIVSNIFIKLFTVVKDLV